MEFNTKKIQQQYQGFLNTKLLWKNTFFGLKQLQLPIIKTSVFNGFITKDIRLGKRVESFTSYYLQQFDFVKIIQENIQVQKGNITIGELDCVLFKDDIPTHLEIVFKFYLYVNIVGATEVEQWIGPNKNDSLQLKIEKLSTKQLPLLFREETKKYLDINVNIIDQKVLFKAQLFVPYANKKVVFKELNSDCVVGFYVNYQELEQFKECKFYIPKKMDWLLAPTVVVSWLRFNDFKLEIFTLIDNKKSPLCWLKRSNGKLDKFFVTWW